MGAGTLACNAIASKQGNSTPPSSPAVNSLIRLPQLLHMPESPSRFFHSP